MPETSATQEAEKLRLQSKVSPGKKLPKTLSQRTSLMPWQIPVIPATWEAELGESPSKACPSKKFWILYEK
jgi:hypothetical protein